MFLDTIKIETQTFIAFKWCKWSLNVKAPRGVNSKKGLYEWVISHRSENRPWTFRNGSIRTAVNHWSHYGPNNCCCETTKDPVFLGILKKTKTSSCKLIQTTSILGSVSSLTRCSRTKIFHGVTAYWNISHNLPPHEN